MNRLVEGLFKGDPRAMARIITLIENEDPGCEEILNGLYPHTGRAYKIGVTGPTGVGKSTLVDKLTVNIRKGGLTVGIIGVDPSSPFTGGALLGDRVRMQSADIDSGMFVRSMATRGSLGGLAKATKRAVDVLDAFGKAIIFMETVGVGQLELDIVEAADTTVVVFVPEFGDGIQTMKAGLMEAGDIFVVNKADREGADRAVIEIERALELRLEKKGWIPPVLKTIANAGEGIVELGQTIERHRQYLIAKNLLAENRRKQIRSFIEEILEEKLWSHLWGERKLEEMLEVKVEDVITGRKSPYLAAEEILKDAGLFE